MKLGRFPSWLAVLLFLLVVWQFALTHSVFASELSVAVSTDKGEYDPGEVVTITVRVLLDGHPVSAAIDRAYIDIGPGAGFSSRHYITGDFTQVSPGVFVARGKAGKPGARQIYVAASTTIKEDCCCEKVCGVGFAFYSVRQVCQPSCYYQPCYPCYQPCYPCVECRAPDFFIKHFVNPADYTGHEKITLSIPNHIMAQLLGMADPVTFREAPPGSVIWSDVPGMGWTNEALADFGLSLDPVTGKIKGYLTAAGDVFDNHFFFIEALNSDGEVIAGIWIEIAFV